ncbi:DUF2690 domain-containing protein [Streptomyces showdoensis]|uniref:DUF2690 domain-containing protein n=1 Tax=Streptomyces showdoensis TaxID=68268 RepID=A0A2P2GS39_STREW|nr:DUF2690 domain-containing protein [Streptomyces showdoensis]KKZ74307.1 hypothetical protein VO63_07600 [Streptomyces showdoensis]
MRNLLRRTAQAGTALLLAAGALSLTGGSAQAATYDGNDPASTSCGGTTSTVRSAAMYDPTFGTHLGTIELRYNSGCRTAWARVSLDYAQFNCGNASAGKACAQAKVVRNSDGRSYSCTVAVGSSSCYTRMVNDAGVSSYAEGFADVAGGITYVRTGSY